MGAFNVPDWFVPKYQDEVTVRAQQKKSRIADRTSPYGTFIGDDCYFPRIGSVETIKSTRLGTLNLLNAAVDWVKFNAVPEFAPIALWDPDRNKLSLPVAAKFGEATAKAISRARDRQVIDALNYAAANGVQNTKGDATENITTIGDYNTVMDLEQVANAIVALGTSEMFDDEDITVVSPFKINVNLQLDPYLAKSDMKSNRPWDRLEWRQYERLAGNATNAQGQPSGALKDGATGVDTFIFARSAVASAMNDDVVEIDERLGAQMANMMGYWFQAASGAILPEGIIRVQSKMDFTLAKAPIPTHTV